jgi:N-acyl-D-amino-acid deacylase
MSQSVRICIAGLLFLASATALRAGSPELDVDAIKSAVQRSIPLIEKSAAEYRERRQCFACHHQALPVLMLTEARRRGFTIDEENLERQLDHTAAHLKRGEENYRSGQGQGGKADTAGWALWTLETGGRKADETTTAVVQFLLNWQADQDHWRAAGNRPPTEASAFTTTYVAVRGLASFGAAEQQDQIAKRRESALKWLLAAEPKDTEDRVFRLRSLEYLGADADIVQSSAKDLIARQAEDGGWAQTTDLKSDAYATGTALVALHESGELSVSDPIYRKGIDYLRRTQLDDGSWKVATRSKPIQEYFESGFPHEKDQFISISATSWAATALLMACPLAAP